MLHKILSSLLCSVLLSVTSIAQLNGIQQYNVNWDTQSKNASESMPCGGGDIGLNVWVEKSSLFVYMARSGNFDENNALLKSGRLRINLSPNIFDGEKFKQELHLNEGYVSVSGTKNGVKGIVKIWTEVYAPVIHIDINSEQKITATATYESWRYQDRILNPAENFANSWKGLAPKNNICRKDIIDFNKDQMGAFQIVAFKQQP
jgi:hypothetical protein